TFSLLERDVAKYPAVTPEIKLTAGEIEKIHPLFPLASWRRFDSLLQSPITEMRSKDIDVFQFGQNVYPSEILSAHRGAAARAVGRLAAHRTVLAIGGVLAEPELENLLFRSRIIVSPYGHCMSSWKDWQALCAGCVLIKPDSEQQKNYLPDIFQDNAWYVTCRSDFADLEEKVAMVL